MWNQIVLGGIGGLAYSLSGLAKKKEREEFDWKKMAPTIILGAVIGVAAGITGQDYGVVANTAAMAGVTGLIENFWKAVCRKFSK